MKSTLKPLLFVIIVCTNSVAGIPLTWGQETEPRQTASPEAIIVDTLVARPAGMVATVVGTAAFIVALPFSLITRDVPDVAEKLIVTPARYTFTRPLGEGVFIEM